jgi:hypothetical protein
MRWSCEKERRWAEREEGGGRREEGGVRFCGIVAGEVRW